MTQATTFNEIPYDWLKPGVYVEVRPNYRRQGLVPFPARTLLIGQKLATGTAEVLRRYPITRDAEGTAYFGAGSIGEAMVKTFRRNRKTGELQAMALADVGGGTQATGKFVFTGTGGGVVPLYIAGRRVRVAVSSAMTNAQRAAAAVAAINAETDLYVTAAQGVNPADNEVLLTARHKGESGNQIDLRVAWKAEEYVPVGLTVAVTAMAGGAMNPDLTAAIDAIANEWWTDIVLPWDDQATLEALAAELAARYVAMGKLDAHAYVGHRGTYGQLIAKGALTNSPHISGIGADAAPQPPWEWAAALAAQGSFHLTNDPARQLRGLKLHGVQAPAAEKQFTEQEQDLLLRGGISTWTALPDGTVTLDRVVTTYKLSNLAVVDRAWLDIMVPKTMTRIRYDWAAHVTLLYPRHKLAPDDSPAADASDAVVTPRRMHGTWAARCKLYERQAWLVDAKRTVAESHFYISENDRNRMEANQQVMIIGNLMVLAAALEFQV